MVQINSFFRQTHNTMATMASLFMLLTVTFSCIQAATHDPPEVLPQFPQARPATHLPDLQDVMGKIKESCPPFGSPDERFKVTVLGTLSPPIGGCASMQTVHHDIVPAFNLWLGSLRYGGGSCDEEGMDHYMFECLSKHPFIEDDNIKGWYVTLYDQTARWSGQKDYRCGLYSMLNDDPPMIQMVIGANRSCDGLSRRMGTVEHRVPDGFRHFEDGSVALLFSKDWPQPISSVDVWRKKRSASQGRTYRFPDWSQGSWLDLQVNGSLIHYDTNYHEKDDVDYDQDNDDEKNGDAEISSGEQYMQRSQQYDPVGMSSRNRRSVPNMNGVKMFRTRTITILNNTKDIDWLKRQLLNDNMRILDEFNLQRERRSVEPKKPKFVLDVLSQTLPELFPTNEFEYGGNYTTKTEEKNKTTNVNDYFSKIQKDSEALNKIFNSVFGIGNVRHKRDLSNQREYVEHGEENSKPRKKRCFGSSAKTTTTERYRDLWFENPPKKGDPMEPFDKTNKYFGTTQNPGGRTIRKGRSVDEDSYNKSKNTNYEKEKQLEKVNEIEKVRSLIRWWNLMRVLPLIEHRIWNQSNTDTKKTEYEVFPDTSMTPVPSPVKYLEFAKILGIPYKEAVLKWRSLERKYRQREAEVDYTAYPGQNHPDIVMRDFDQTFDGIEYDFNPLYPEGTVDDPTAYRVLTLPGGYRIEPRLSRRTTFAEKQLGATSESVKVDSDFQYIQSNSLNDGLNTLMPKRIKRSSTLPNQQQRATTKFTWNCIMPVDNDEKQPHNLESGAKFLVYGGRIMEKTNENSNNQPEPNLDTLFDSKKDSKMTYGCLWLVPRGPNIIEFSIIGTGLPDKEQNIQSFAKQLCTEKKSVSKDSNIRNKKKLLPRRHLWVTETRADEAKRVPVGCPIPPGTVFYGEIPAPPPSSTVTNNSQSVLPRLCVKLISSADDCTNGRAGAIDQMKYTVSECVERDASTGTSLQTMTAQQTIFEEREYKCLGQWTEPQQHINPEVGEKAIMLTYIYVKRLNPIANNTDQFECFVGTIIPNDEGSNPETTKTLLLTEAGSGTLCSRRSDPYRSGMKLVGTKINKEGACKGSEQPAQDIAGGSWYPLKPQPISPSIPSAENSGGTWYAAPPVPVVAQGPTTMMPILTGRHTGGNGALFTSRQNERRPQSATPPPKTNDGNQNLSDNNVMLLVIILFIGHLQFITHRYF